MFVWNGASEIRLDLEDAVVRAAGEQVREVTSNREKLERGYARVCKKGKETAHARAR